MSSPKTGILTAVIAVFVVTCISLSVVGGLVIWMAAHEGAGPGDLVSGLLSERQSARPFLPDAPPNPTRLPQSSAPPSPTPAPVEAVATGELAVGTLPTRQPANPPPPDSPAPAAPASIPQIEVETAIESPIRPGSPLPERPATRLVIPAMGLDVPVILSPIENQTWKVDHLGKDFVGHLEGTASPGDPSNVVLAGHVTIAHDVYGPFAGLGQLEPGDVIIVYAGDQSYTYVVDYRQLVGRTDIQVAYPTDTGRVTLITCSNWSDDLGVYQERLIVVGYLTGGES